MVRMRPVSMILASASLAVLLSACGSDIHPGDQTAQAPSASSGNAGNNNVAPNASGYWQLAGRIFQRSGQSEQSTVDVNDHVESTLEIHGRIPPATPVNGAAASTSVVTTSGTPVATETLDSLLRVEFTGRTAGTYQITTDANRFRNAGRQARLAVLRVAVRDTTTRQETSYIATAGTIEVTLGADRKFHVRSVADLPVRQLSISQAAGGVTAMPAQTQLSIRD
ncbi:hypothetical protein PPG32_04465 [Lautropia mirabilis]|uniref:hypothetical protein n=2 Tax=Lautropia mirabilis TaxID=47671 RepID=UPI0023499AC4|nr:hypothetical protein [Lautropia mirabilis]MDC6093355.1 hypothetical protein [Lautropia mirabilis]